jgi:hypothetical protein
MFARLVALLALSLSGCGGEPTAPPATVPPRPSAAPAAVPPTTASANAGLAGPAPSASALQPTPPPATDSCGKPAKEVLEIQGWSAALGRHLYFHSTNTLRTFYRFDTRTGAWETLPAVEGRRFFNLVRDGEHLLAVGGMAVDEEPEEGSLPPPVPINSVEAFDFSSCSWRKVGAIPPGPPYRVAVTFQGSLYLFGGYLFGNTTSGKPQRTVSVVSLADWKQQTRKPMPKLGHRVLDAVVVGERIYLFGDSNAVHIYDPKTDTWSRGGNSGGHGTAADNLFVAHEGRIFSFPHTWGPIEVAAYDTASNTWADLDPLPGLDDKAGDHVFAAEVIEGALTIAAQKSRPGLRSTLVFRHDELSGGWVKAP